MIKDKTILFCVLNWGLGHASRSLALIRSYEQNNCTVMIASDGLALDLLKKELPGRKFYTLPSYRVTYAISPTKGTILSMPSILYAIMRERQSVASILAVNTVDLIVSDNRFGAFSADCPSYLLIHQLNPFFHIKNRWASAVLKYLYARMLNRFSRIMVPDSLSYQLSGSMSVNNYVHIPIEYAGILSRFDAVPVAAKIKDNNKIVIILSGPEPARSRFEAYIFSELAVSQLSATVVLGRKVRLNEEFSCMLDIREIIPSEELNLLFKQSDLVISRSGYSSIMDYIALGVNALLIPTPRMPEQEYLAERMKLTGKFPSIPQKCGELSRYLVNYFGAR